MMLEAVLCVSPSLMNATKEKIYKRENSILCYGLKVCKIFCFPQHVMDGTGSPKWCKWFIGVPNTRKQNERTKIIIYVSPSS